MYIYNRCFFFMLQVSHKDQQTILIHQPYHVSSSVFINLELYNECLYIITFLIYQRKTVCFYLFARTNPETIRKVQ